MTLLILFVIYSFLVFSFLPKNVRYVQSLDIIYRLFAALFIIDFIGRIATSVPFKKAVMVVAISLMVFTDAKAFYYYNVEFEIYDPICYNLLQAEKIIFGVGEVPLDQTYLNWSYLYYQKKDFNKAIEYAQKALTFNPNFTTAYINICSAYNEMKDWDHAIEAGKRAVETDPNNQLAKNNLNWAISQKQLGSH